jgi:hypothetical protein
LAEVNLTQKDVKIILKALLTAQFPVEEQKEAFDLYTRLVNANQNSK